MGACVSTGGTPEEIEQRQKSKAIDLQLRAESKHRENVIKILLLVLGRAALEALEENKGAGESGKSTVVKQMKIIHGDGFSREELENKKPVIFGNLVSSVKVVLKNMETLKIAFESPSTETQAAVVNDYDCSLLMTTDNTLPENVKDAVQVLWKDAGIKECFERAIEYQLNDSAPYYFENIDRILSPDYLPDEQDVLRSRVQTTGIVETAFKVKQMTYRVVDVGGQRSERRKWISCFDDVRAVLFVCAMSGYDMTLFEDGKTNRLEESLNLFQAICNNKFFQKTAMILFLNKVDLFKQKLLTSDHHLRLFFSQYTGPDRDVDSAGRFIQEQFMERNLNKSKMIYPHFTTATDTSNIKVVMKVVLDTVIRENLEAANLL